MLPQIDCGEFPIKRVVGESVRVEADIFSDGHDIVRALLLWRPESQDNYNEIPLKPAGNDRWQATFRAGSLERHYYTVEAWVDHLLTWISDLAKRHEAGSDIAVDLKIGAGLLREAASRATGVDAESLKTIADKLETPESQAEAAMLATGEQLRALALKYPDRRLSTTHPRELMVEVDRETAGFSAWYEFFPRSCPRAEEGRHATFRDCENLIPEVARMGFDVIYLPPIHPIGEVKRKGKNNNPSAEPGEPGSPWAIGSKEGGHKAVHPQLGTLEDFGRLIEKVKDHGMEVAMDVAFQCAPDHPYVKEHPEWFLWRPDGSVQHAENPPKKYEDIIPINFESEDWEALWDELHSVVLHWLKQGVRIFRVDNPHTKAFPFWQWLIEKVKRDYPEAIFLSEAFTRPKVMYRLAKIGFSQSYTYFTWRNTKWELMTYLEELTRTEVREFYRPNFWTNTPDILPELLQYGGRPAFVMRLILASTLSSNYGIYGPAFELLASEALPGREEYLDSEKFEIKRWERGKAGNLANLIARLNRIRKENPALQSTWNVSFHETENDKVLFYSKADETGENIIFVIVNLDPYNEQTGRIHVPVEEYGIDPDHPYLLHDLIGDEKLIWYGKWNHLRLDPQIMPAQVFRVHRRMRRETDFDYFL